jgi:hypothetical protein
MPKTRNLFKNIKLEVAASTRKCHASSTHKIAKGKAHLAFYEGGMRQNICRECFLPMIPVAERHWNEIAAELI